MAALDAAVSIWQDIDIAEVRDKSCRLTSLFIDLVLNDPLLASLVVLSPRQAERRGSQVSLQHEHAYSIVQAMIEKGIVCDYREANILRFGFAPLYISQEDVVQAVAVLREIFISDFYREPRFQIKKVVT